MGVAGLYALGLANTFDSAEKIVDPFPKDSSRPPVAVVPEAAPAPQNILLLGSDTRGDIGSLANAGGLSDAIMVVHIPSDRTNLQVMSFMRDSWVNVPGYGDRKINSALALGGVQLAIQTVESLINSRIDHVAIVDFEGFKGITNSLGGIVFDNPIGFNSSHLPGHFFAQGPLQLDGTQALALVRERYAFRDGDYQRVRNQQIFIKAVLNKTLSRETLTNPLRIGNLVGSIAPFLAVDDGLNSAYAASLGFELRDVPSEKIRFFTIPTLGTGNVNGQSIVRLDFAQLEVIQQMFQSDTLDEYTPPAEPSL